MLLRFRSRFVEVKPRGFEAPIKVRETETRIFAGVSKEEDPIITSVVKCYSKDQDQPAVAQKEALMKALSEAYFPKKVRTELWEKFWKHSKRTAALKTAH